MSNGLICLWKVSFNSLSEKSAEPCFHSASILKNYIDDISVLLINKQMHSLKVGIDIFTKRWTKINYFKNVFNKSR